MKESWCKGTDFGEKVAYNRGNCEKKMFAADKSMKFVAHASLDGPKTF